MHYYSDMLYSDLERVEVQKKVVYEPRLQALIGKAQKYEELWRALEMEWENGASIVLHDLIMRTNQVKKGSSFTI